MKNKITDFGFVFGSAEVTRIAGDENGASIIGLKTPKHELSIRITKTGKVTIYNNKGQAKIAT